jgi:hypothetical protein
MLTSPWAHALKVIENKRFYITFPSDERVIASRLVDAVDSMSAFLERQGLPVTTPLHIVLDGKRDQPEVKVSMIPHREIRVPIRAPGVLEDGFLEKDPWLYFLFKGLCLQGIFSERSGFMKGLHCVFGEVISPNIILPEWALDGISHLLYERYKGRSAPLPLGEMILMAGPIPPLDHVSHHPEIWPGRFSYRIYGRPFVRWLDNHYGWEKLLAILRLHGSGLIPVEIDREARRTFGMSWNQLWEAFRKEYHPMLIEGEEEPMVGYWPEPFVYWNDVGVYPGLLSNAFRGRYGYVEGDGQLWLSLFDNTGVARVVNQRGDSVKTAPRPHIWDPGPGPVAVTREGHRPYLVLGKPVHEKDVLADLTNKIPEQQMIPAPHAVMQLSGPVMDRDGRVAVAANRQGNWDIWIYDGSWHRITDSPSIEMDPWLEKGNLIFASNASGRFQIHRSDMKPLTQSPTAAVLPRHDNYLQLEATGYTVQKRDPGEPLSLTSDLPVTPMAEEAATEPMDGEREYSFWKSIWPNYMLPDVFIDVEDLQLGLATVGRDVSREYAWDAGVRYTIKDDFLSFRLGAQMKGWHSRATRYPLRYQSAGRPPVDETRLDIRLGWESRRFKDFLFSANWRHYELESVSDGSEDEWWGELSWRHKFRRLRTALTVDLFTNGSQSLYGELSYKFGKRINTALNLVAGKTWGELVYGHNTFRVGGNTGEGFFTKRPTRLFPLRGFPSNILDAGQAAVGTIEVSMPLVRLQTGYKTLPLFLHNIRLGTFVDTGFAAQDISSDDLLISAGLEVITGLELAWNFKSDVRIGVAWPLRQPVFLDEEGPVFLFQLGLPL